MGNGAGPALAHGRRRSPTHRRPLVSALQRHPSPSGVHLAAALAAPRGDHPRGCGRRLSRGRGTGDAVHVGAFRRRARRTQHAAGRRRAARSLRVPVAPRRCARRLGPRAARDPGEGADANGGRRLRTVAHDRLPVALPLLRGGARARAALAPALSRQLQRTGAAQCGADAWQRRTLGRAACRHSPGTRRLPRRRTHRHGVQRPALLALPNAARRVTQPRRCRGQAGDYRGLHQAKR